MNSTIAYAVAKGWIKFPEPEPEPVLAPKPSQAPPQPKPVLASKEQFDSRLAWRLWNQGATLTYVARAVGVKRSAVMTVIREGRPADR